MKEHLACTRKNVVACSKVPDEVKKELKEYLMEFENTKTLSQMKFEEMVVSGSYYSSGGWATSTTMEALTPLSSTRGVRGPMDHIGFWGMRMMMAERCK